MTTYVLDELPSSLPTPLFNIHMVVALDDVTQLVTGFGACHENVRFFDLREISVLSRGLCRLFRGFVDEAPDSTASVFFLKRNLLVGILSPHKHQP